DCSLSPTGGRGAVRSTRCRTQPPGCASTRRWCSPRWIEHLQSATPVKVSVVIPAYNEAGSIAPTVGAIAAALDAAERDYEVVVVDDSSTDDTAAKVAALSSRNPRIRLVRSPYNNGFGFAVRAGLEQFEGDAVAIMMGDGSDDPRDM